jgi:hypothetical protein
MKKLFYIALMIVFFTSQTAQAAKLTNYGEKAISIVVQENGNKSDVTVESNETIEDFCVSGCTVTLKSGEVYTLNGTEIVALEEDGLFFDTEDNAEADAIEESNPEAIEDQSQ